KAQGMWRNPGDEPVFTSTLELDMGTVEASLAGPKRPQDRVALSNVPKAFAASNELEVNAAQKDHRPVDYVLNGHQYQLPDGAVVIAAITSCTN
ncbi:aconitase family protein, partial [Escherichia coli]